MLAVEGAAVHPEEGVAVIADVHLGYEWARGAGGDVVPSHSLAETVERLGTLLARVKFDRLVVAGDLTESSERCPMTEVDLRRLAGWLDDRGIKLIRLSGNHDRPRRPPLPGSIEVDGWAIGHGHRPIEGDRRIFGHHHPALRGPGVTAKCFLIDDRTIALPAFSTNAAGLDVGSATLPESLRAPTLRCIAGAGAELLDFGPLPDLRAKLRALPG